MPRRRRRTADREAMMVRRFSTAALLLCAVTLLPCLLIAIPLNTAVFNGADRVLDLGGVPVSGPLGVAVDSSGNIYIADSGNDRIVKRAADGTGSILAVNGLTTWFANPQGVAVDGAGNLYVADTGNSRIVLVTPAADGSVVDMGSVTLSVPQGVAVDASGNIYVADSGNDQIVKVTAAGAGTVLTFGNICFLTPRGVAVDAFGTIYVADQNNGRIISSATNRPVGTSTVTLTAPGAVALDVFGTLYVADAPGDQVIVLPIAAVPFGNLPVGATSGNTQTLAFTVTGSLSAVSALTLGSPSLDFTVVPGSGTTCTSATANTSCTVQVRFNPRGAGLSRGSVVLTGSSSNILVAVPVYGVGVAPTVALTTAKATVVATPGQTLGLPYQMAIDGAGNRYIGNYQPGKIVKLSADGSTASVLSTGSITITDITGVVLDGAGNLYISDHLGARLVKLTPDGTATALDITAGGVHLGLPTQLDMDAGGNLIIADFSVSRIVKLSAASLSTGATTLTGVVVPTPGQTFTGSTVTGVAADLFGNIYIANRAKVVKATPAGSASDLAVPGVTLSTPQGVTVDGGGNVYIAAVGQIVQVSTTGVASSISFAGLSTPATLSSSLYGVTADVDGTLYIPDWTNNRIVKLDRTSPAPLSFASTTYGQTSSDSPKTLTVQNIGNASLTFSVPSSGTNPVAPASFALGNTGTCPQVSSTSAAGTLAPGVRCTLTVSFTPTAVGAI